MSVTLPEQESRNHISRLKKELTETVKRLFAAGVLFRGEHANLSARLDGSRMVISRGGSVGQMDDDSFAVVRFDGTVEEGSMENVLAEVVSMHAAVYQARPSVGSVIHTHAPNATAFAVAHEPIPAVYEPLLRFGVTGSVPVVDWAPRGSRESVQGIVRFVQEDPGVSAVLLANHGVLGFSSTPSLAAQLLATLDEAAELILKARLIGGEKPLPAKAFDQVKENMSKFGSKLPG